MISFSHLGEYGRLGNQLFQYAILKSVQNMNTVERFRQHKEPSKMQK